jgi:hypothetical protein
MIKVQKERDRVFITLTSQLDREDVYELVSDLQKWLDDTIELPKFNGMSEDKVKEAWEYSNELRKGPVTEALLNARIKKEAKEQNDSKNKLAEEMRRMFVDVLDTEYLETKFATVYKLDEINREVEILRKKLNKQ